MPAMWFKEIIGHDKRTRHRWVSGHLEKGEKRKREAEIAKQITAFGEEMDRKKIGFRSDRDAWEAYWKKYPRAHMELVGASVDEVLGEKAFQVFCGFWLRRNKPIVVRFEDDGTVAAPPMLLTLGEGANRVRANPIDALRSDDIEVRSRAVRQVDRAILRSEKRKNAEERKTAYLLKLRHGLETGAKAIETTPGEVTVQGLLMAPDVDEVMEMLDDDDAE